MDWREALEPESSLWTQFPDVDKVIHISNEPESIDEIAKYYEEVVVIPLSAHDATRIPKGFRTLIPPVETIEILNNKKLFQDFMVQRGFRQFVPKLIDPTLSSHSFPFIVKREDLFGGIGVFLIWDQERFDWALNNPLVRGHRYLFQEYIEGEVEYVSHVICKAGEILWNVTLEGPVPEEVKINMGPFAKKVVPTNLVCFEIFLAILRELKYSGPACINFKLRDGKPLIFEINPRFGGSLFLPEFAKELAQAFSSLLGAKLEQISIN